VRDLCRARLSHFTDLSSQRRGNANPPLSEATEYLLHSNADSMNIMDSSNQDATNTYNEIGRTVVSFMVDCGMKDADVNPSHLSLAFEYAYEPLSRFWRDFDLATVMEAVSARFPDWHSAAQARNQSAAQVLREVDDILHANATDEANAEMLMALPVQVRPTEAQAATDWICAELQKRGLESERRFAERDGWRCGERALEVARSLEQAAVGIQCERVGTRTARMVRDRMLAAGRV
jgi:hypothetical protein